MKIICDECKNEMDLETVELIETMVFDGSAMIYFQCTNCKHQFIACTITAKGLKIRDELNKKKAEFKEFLRTARIFDGNETTIIESYQQKIMELADELKMEVFH